MAAGKHDFKIEQGSTFRLDVSYRDSNGDPINLSGYTARMQARPTPTSSTIYINISTTLGGVTITPAIGLITLALSATQTAALDFSTARYDLEIQSSTGVVTRLIEGTITLSREVTR